MITFTRDWRGYAKGSSVSTLADTIEALAVAEGAAIYGGVAGPLNSYLDADNRVQAQVDPAGNVFVFQQSPNSVILAGDSMLARTFVNSTAASSIVNNGNGTATALFPSGPLTSALPVAVGDIIGVEDNPTPILNQALATVTAINTGANTITYTLTGPYSSLPGGSNGYVKVRRKQQPLSLFSYWNMLSGGELVITADCSQGGAQLSHVGELLNSSAASSAKFGVFLAGRNDIYAANRTYAQIIALAEPVIRKLRTLCDVMIVITTPPQDSALVSGWSTAKMQVQLQYETWLKQFSRKLGAVILDAGAVSIGTETYRNPTSINANPTTGWSPDGTHQGTRSSYGMAKALALLTAKYITPTLQWPTSLASTYANDPTLKTDGVFLTGTGGTVTPAGGSITGTAPDGTIVEVQSGTPALTTSLIARTVANDGDAVGNNLRIVATNASGAGSFAFRIAINAARFANGEQIRAQAKVKISSSGTPGIGNPTNLFTLDLVCRVLTATTLFGEANVNVGASQAQPEAFNPILVTPPMTIRPSLADDGAPTSGYLQLVVLFTGAGGCTIDIGHPHIRAESSAITSIST